MTERQVEAGQHICAMYFGVRERDNVLLPFLRDGLFRGQKCFAAIQEPDPGALIANLGERVEGRVDVPDSVARDQLEIKTSTDHILSAEDFDPVVIVEFWDTLVTSALRSGFDFVRLSAEARWWLPQLPSIGELFHYESELNRFTGRHPQAVLCLYDLSQYSESIVVDLLKTHPLVLLSGMALENPYYVPPDELIP